MCIWHGASNCRNSTCHYYCMSTFGKDFTSVLTKWKPLSHKLQVIWNQNMKFNTWKVQNKTKFLIHFFFKLLKHQKKKIFLDVAYIVLNLSAILYLNAVRLLVYLFCGGGWDYWFLKVRKFNFNSCVQFKTTTFSSYSTGVISNVTQASKTTGFKTN
jgi:hypothetical protein